jgi:hypothetical protein
MKLAGATGHGMSVFLFRDLQQRESVRACGRLTGFAHTVSASGFHGWI